MTNETSAHAEQTSYDLNAPAAVLARMDMAAKSYFKFNRHKHSEAELDKLSAALTASVESDDDYELRLCIQSRMIDSAFTTLLLSATFHDSLNEETFAMALRAHRQFRMTCGMLGRVKNASKQTERNGGNAGTHAE